MKLVMLVALAACSKKTMEMPNLVRDADIAKPSDATAAADAPAAAAAKLTADKVVFADGIACALLSDATVRCWHGAEPPVDEKLRGVKDVVASHAFACALLDDSSVTCWGDIGFGTQAKNPKPAGVPGVTKVQKIFAVGGAGCAAISDGELACWGDVDERGRIGAGGAHRAPTAVAGVDHVAAVAERAMLREDGDLAYWDGTAWKRAGISDGKDVASAGDSACVLRADQNVYCMSPQPICGKPAPAPAPAPKPAKPAKKPAKAAKGKKPPPPPPPPEPPKSALEKLPLGKVSRLAFAGGELCAEPEAGKLTCVDRACKVTIKMAPKPPAAPREF
jgi:hypothetical protein